VLEDIEDDDPDPVDVAELRRLLYGLHAIVELHFDQEEEDYFSLLDASGPSVALIPPPRHGSETGR
jgi:hypothetical protein